MTPLPYRPPSLSRKIAFALTTILGLLAAVEATWRCAFGWNSTWLDCHRYDPVLGWRLRENWTGRWEWTAGLSHINPQGLRDDQPVEVKKPGERRLLVLGDSVTFGAKVRTEETYCKRLEAHLAEAGKPWRVLNGGVTGYDPAQEADWLERIGLGLEPDALAIGFCWNDVFPSDRSEWSTRYGANGATEWLNGHSLTFYQFQRGIQRLQARVPSYIGKQAPGPTCAERVEAGWPAIEHAYTRIAARARQHELPVFLILFPTRFDAEGLIDDGLRARLNTFAAQEGWSVIDLREVFAADPDALYLPSDNLHPTVLGHQRSAEAIGKALIERKLIR